MQPAGIRFTIRWLMETTALVAVALCLLESSPQALFALLYLCVLYACGLAPLRRLFGFAPVRRFFKTWSSGHLRDSPGLPTGDDAGIREIATRRRGRRWTPRPFEKSR